MVFVCQHECFPKPVVCPQADPKYIHGLKIKAPESRLRHFVAACASKRMDESTGNLQPAYKMDGMKIMCEFPKPKGDDEGADVGERKQV